MTRPGTLGTSGLMTRVSGQDRREERVLVQRPGPEMVYVGDADKDSAQGRAELQSHRPESEGHQRWCNTRPLTQTLRRFPEFSQIENRIIGSGRPCSMFPANVFILIFGAAVLKVHREAHSVVASLRASRLTVRSWSLHAPERRASAVLQQAGLQLSLSPLQNANCSAHSH